MQLLCLYKKTNSKIKEKINKNGKEILKILKFWKKEPGNQLHINRKNNGFFTFKEDKENFQNNPTVRLINSAKNEIGRISKFIYYSLIRQLKVKQWRNTQNFIDWFIKLVEKSKHKFSMFGIIKGFYPSVKGTLLIKSIIFAKKHVNIPDKDKIIVKQTQKSFISSNNEPWVKKKSLVYSM